MDDRETIVRGNIQIIGEESFPDDEVKWNVKNIVNKEEYTFVEADPRPATVGHDKFTFVLRFMDDQTYRVAGCYCWENNRWGLLFIDPEEGDGWKEIFTGI